MKVATNPDEIVSYCGTDMAIRDVPDATVRALLGYGHDPFEIASRDVWPGGWPYRPQTCLIGWDGLDWVWINEGQNLVCPGCGLEGT